VPTAAELTGDFSAFLSASNPGNSAGVVQNIDDPLTGTQFPGNIIPTSRLDPASLGLAKFLPVGTGNGEVAYTTPESQNVDEYIARIDHVISEKNSIHARFFEDDINLHASYSPVDIRDYVFGYHTVVTNVMVQDSNAFSPNLLNILTLTYSTTPVNKIAPQNSPDPATFGVMNIYQPPTPFIQNIAVDGEFTISGGAVGPFHNSDEAVSDDVTWVKGSHILSLGFGVENARAQVGDLFDVPGTFTFTNNVTNNAMASFMLGYLRTFIQGNGEFGNNENWYTDFYANDTWRVSSRLTLTYGLRYEPYLAWKEFNGRFEQFLPANAKAGVISQVYPNAPAGLVFRGDPGVPDRGVRGSMTNFAPRVGFAYDLAGNGRSSVRGGFGAFYDSHTASIIMGRSDDVDPFSPQINLTEPKGPFSNPLLGVVNPFPAPEMPSRNAAFPAPVSVIEYDPSRKYQVPVSYNYNLIVEQSFFSNLLFQVAYVGEHAIHDKTSVELNPSVYIPGSSLLTDARRIFPGYSTIIMDGQVGSVHYNSLQVTARQQATHNLYVLLAYTFSKDLDNIPNGGNNNDIGSDGVATLPSYYPNYQAFDYGPSGNDRRHNLVASYILHLPTFPRFSRRTRLLLGGWRVTGMVNLRSGAPLTVKVAQDISSTNLGNDSAVVLNRANSAVYGANSCVKQALAYCASWLNSADFALPASGTFGPPGKGQFEGPWLFNWNMGLVKDFKIEKRFNLEFRGEFFNVFNHVNKSNPNTTFGDAGFGTITAAGNPRIGQLALKLAF
jgi:hypothetical protein